MFGYLQIQKSELLVREFDAYKAVYCGLCKQMGKSYSFLSRLSLSYDCTFYTMLLMALNQSCTGFKDGHCTFNPLKKCKFAVDSSTAYLQASSFSVILGYYKLKDDIIDSGFLKKLLYRILMPFFSHWRKKAAKNYPELDNLAATMMQQQSKIENDSASIDSCADPTAHMLAGVLALESDDKVQKRVLYELGYQLGRWVYLIDACDDYEKDIKHNCFNPIANQTGKSTHLKNNMANILNQSLARAYDAYVLLDIKDFKGILDNMMQKGFPTVQNKVTQKLTEAANE